MMAEERVSVLPNDPEEVKAFILERVGVRVSSNHCMSVRNFAPSTNGLHVVTHAACRILRRWRSASGSRRARATKCPNENGIAHFLEHMAFKGTEAALGPGDRRGNRIRRRRDQCLDRHGNDHLLCPRPQERLAAGARHPRRHPDRVALRCRTSSSASAMSSCRRSPPPATRRTISSSIWPRAPLSARIRSAVPSSAPMISSPT